MILRLLARRRNRRGTDAFPSISDPTRIFLIRLDRIGDAVVSTPIISLLLERFPNARVDVMLGMKNAAVARLLPGVDRVVVLPVSLGGVLRTLRSVRAERYDLCINLLAKDSVSGALTAAWSGARTRIGFDGELGNLYDIAVPRPVDPPHIVPETSHLLAPLGIAPIGPEPARESERLHVLLAPDEIERARTTLAPLLERSPDPLVVMNISGSDSSKFWGLERYAATVAELLRRNARPVVAARPADEALLERIVAETGCERLPIRASLVEFVAMLSFAGYIVTPDTSVVHIAAALGKPTVMLTPSASVAASWRPWGVPARVLSAEGSIERISTDRVLEAILSLMAETEPAPRPLTSA